MKAIVFLTLTLLPVALAQTLICSEPNAAWCNAVCNAVPSFCPSGTCTCRPAGTTASASASPSPSRAPIAVLNGYYESHGCCVADSTVGYYISGGSVFQVPLTDSGVAKSAPTLCSSFTNAIDIALTTDGGLFVADLNAATVFYVAPGCGAKKVVVTSTVQQIPAPISVTIASDGSLLIGANPRNVYKVILDVNNDYVSHTIMATTATWLDAAIEGDWAYVSTGNKITRVNTLTGAVLDFFDGSQRNLPDIQDISVTDQCGLFFAVPDSNQVWRCPNENDASSCELYCAHANIDSVTCTNVWSPWGIALDCSCNLYITNTGGNLISRISADSTTGASTVVVTGLNQPTDFVLYVPTAPGCPASASRSASSSVSPSRSLPPSSSPSRSRSPSRTPSPSPSASPAPPSPTASRSATRSPSPSRSTTPAPPSPSASRSTTPAPPSPSRSPSPTPSSSPLPSPFPASLAAYYETHPCCVAEDAILYFINSGDLYVADLDANGDVQGTPRLCGDFVNAVDIAIDASGGVFVADQGAATVSFVGFNCAGRKTVFSWTGNQIPAPQALTIASDGSLLVAVTPQNVYRVVINSATMTFVSSTKISTGQFWQDQAIIGNVAYVANGRRILRVDTTSFSSSVFLDINQFNLPDIQDVAVTSECGLFFAVPDSNQIWWCPNLNDASTCKPYCIPAGIDTDTCINTWDPYGLALDCNCNLYAANEGSGRIVRFDYGTTPLVSEVILSGLFHPTDVAVFVPTGVCGVSASRSPSPSASVSPSPSASRTSSVSPSPSPTASESASTSPSATTTPSSSATRSRTASPSPSPLFTFAMDINDLNQVCVQGQCPELDETIKSQISDASTNARIVGLITYINHRVPAAIASTICNGGTGGYNGITNTLICSRVATSSEITNLNDALSGVKLYIKQSFNLPLPPMTLPFTFLAPLTYPNMYRERFGVFGIIACPGYAGVDLAVAWTTPRLCWNDSYFGIVVCHVGGTGLNSVDGGGTYVDNAGNVLSPNNPHKKVTCVG